mmetsp:Transcript_7014/g.11262  ORF Transcript_7014/g.11262 Transcript_7014/m.11262 type:complete len:98 (-) Transcript_7014:377-670(-)
MIEEGLVDIFIKEKGDDRPVVTLKRGSFFGEKALLSSDVRTNGHVYCIVECQVHVVTVGGLCVTVMLGDLQNLLDRSYVARDEALSLHCTMLQCDGR